MEKIDERRVYRILCFAAILISAVFNTVWMFKIKVEGYFICAIISLVILSILLVRVCFRNVKKWEMLIYYILGFILYVILVYAIFRSGLISAGEYDSADSNESVGFFSMFRLIFVGVPSIIVCFVLNVIGLVLTFKNK